MNKICCKYTVSVSNQGGIRRLPPWSDKMGGDVCTISSDVFSYSIIIIIQLAFSGNALKYWSLFTE